MIVLFLACSNIGGFGPVESAALVECDDGSLFGLAIAARKSCREPEDTGEGGGEVTSFCELTQALSGGNCDGRVQEDTHKLLNLQMDADGLSTIRQAPCASSPDDPRFGDDEELDATFEVVSTGGGVATLAFDGELRGEFDIEFCE